MKLKLKTNKEKEKLNYEIEQLQDYMRSLGPGDEYQTCLEELGTLMRIRDDMSFWHKLRDALPWLTLVATGFTTIATVYTGLHHDKTRMQIAELAWQKEEKESELKNGTVFSMSKE